MANLWRIFYNSRIGQYLTCGLLYFVWWKFAGFEFAVIICLSTILGEIYFQDINNKLK
jgi:hypothetical protein